MELAYYISAMAIRYLQAEFSMPLVKKIKKGQLLRKIVLILFMEYYSLLQKGWTQLYILIDPN